MEEGEARASKKVTESPDVTREVEEKKWKEILYR